MTKYKQLTPFTLKKWDGKNFDADYAWDDISSDEEAKVEKHSITGYSDGQWVCKEGWKYDHVALLKENHGRRMTNLELAKWISDGNGQRMTKGGYISTMHSYVPEKENNSVEKGLKIRPWNTIDWVEPTVDMIKQKD